MIARSIPLLLTVGVGACFAAPLTAADLRTDVARMLEAGARNSPGSLAEVDAQYRALKSRAPNDHRLDRAWAVVLLNQRKYSEALPLLAAQIRSHPADLDAACWYAWAQVQCRRYDLALASVTHIGSRIADPQRAPEESRLAAAHLLGRIVGYLERVKPGSVTSEKLSSVKNQLLSQLNGPLLESFDAGSLTVAAQLAALQAEQQARQAEQTAAAEQQKQTALETLAGNRQQVAERQTELDSTAEKLRDTAREWEVLRQQIASVTADRTRLTAQIAVAQSQLTDAPFRQAQQIALGLAASQKEAVELDRRLVQLTTRASELRKENADETESAVRSEAEIREAAKRAKALEKRVHRLEVTKASSPALTMQMRSLSTYMPFPFEEQRARVLRSFEN